MKKITILVTILLVILLPVVLTACGNDKFTVVEGEGNKLTFVEVYTVDYYTGKDTRTLSSSADGNV